MPEDHMVGGLDEAVALAERWRAAGTHTWFRGQAQLWPLMSTLGRRFKAGDAGAVETRIGHVCDWMSTVPALRHLLEEEQTHAFFAVLQHYGVPTHYVDFTTEPDVSGFFAAHDQAAVSGGQGCIIAIEPDGFVEMLRTTAEVKGLPRDAWPEAVSVTVANLWRMQAQSGHFVFLPIDGVERWYGYDRILFTHDGRPHPIPVERIYPDRKSGLEVQLDEFFTEELMHNNQAHMSTVFEQLRQQGFAVEHVDTEAPDRTAHLRPGVGPHPSWSVLDPAWYDVPEETYIAAMSNAPAVRVAVPAGERSKTEEAVRETLRGLFDAQPECRAKALRWTVFCNGETDRKWDARLGRVWDGMRRLPYSDEQMVTAIAVTVAMSVCGEPVGDRITLELATDRGVTSRARVDSARIRGAYREDLADVLRAPSLTDKPRLLLQALQIPSLMFDFAGLVDLFATEMIAAQVAHDRTDVAVFFSPADLTVIGEA